jgi:hypothetical protein
MGRVVIFNIFKGDSRGDDVIFDNLFLGITFEKLGKTLNQGFLGGIARAHPVASIKKRNEVKGN